MKRWISTFTVLIIIAGIIWSFEYLRDMHPGAYSAKLDQSGMENISMRFKGIRLIGKSQGKKLWVFTADSIDISRDRQNALFSGRINGSILKNEEPAVGISASELLYGIYTRNIRIPGDAVIKVTDGPTLNAKDISWDNANSKLMCSGGINASIAGSTLHGKTMTADLNAKTILITKVKGVIRIPEK